MINLLLDQIEEIKTKKPLSEKEIEKKEEERGVGRREEKWEEEGGGRRGEEEEEENSILAIVLSHPAGIEALRLVINHPSFKGLPPNFGLPCDDCSGVDILNLLVGIGYQVCKEDLVNACALGQLEKVKFCLTHGINPNDCDFDGLTPLLNASIRGYREIVRVLLEHGADVSQLPIKSASRWGHLSVLKLLLPKEPSSSSSSSPSHHIPLDWLLGALSSACMGASLDCVSFLLNIPGFFLKIVVNGGCSPILLNFKEYFRCG